MLVPDYAQPDFLFLPERAPGTEIFLPLVAAMEVLGNLSGHLSTVITSPSSNGLGALWFSDMEIFLAQLQFDLISLFPVFQQGIKFFP